MAFAIAAIRAPLAPRLMPFSDITDYASAYASYATSRITLPQLLS